MARTARVSAPVPLGSLTQRGTHRGHCDQCGSERVTEISMTLADQTPVRFVHCLACEAQGWHAEDSGISRDRVLAKASARS